MLKKIPSKFQNVTINIELLKPGQHIAVFWEKTPVWIIKRTNDDVKNIENTDFSKLGAPHGENWISQFIKAYDNKPNLLELDQLPLEKEIYRSYKQWFGQF